MTAVKATAFVDSNVVLYLLSGELHKANQAEELLRARPIVSVQVLNEVTSVCLRKLRLPWAEVEAVIAAVKAHASVVPLTVESHALAMDLAQRCQLSFYDAHVVASALQAGAQTLYSEDMHHGLEIQGLLILNPFLAPA
jgi:predicted nucleic acid-binding protein